MIRLGIAGGRGYVGVELLKLLAGHGGFEVAAVGSRERAGRRVADEIAGAAFPSDLRFEDLSPEAAAARELDAWVLALPNGEAARYVAPLTARRPDVILVDVSADHRFDASWVYGLPERGRERLRGARRIANPGCYATGMQLGLAPFLDVLDLDAVPQIFGVSGWSGAGTTPSPRNDPERLRDNLIPYGLAGHLHEHEVRHQLGRPVRFFPHVAPFFRGITLTISLPLVFTASAAKLEAQAAEHYAGEPLVTVSAGVPEVRDVAGHHGARLVGFATDSSGRHAVLIVTLDNLLKGAATQALQNLNLATGQDELRGIPTG